MIIALLKKALKIGIVIIFRVCFLPCIFFSCSNEEPESLENTFEVLFCESDYCRALSVIQSQDGNYLFIGDQTDWHTSNSDTYLVKIDGVGNELWTRTFSYSIGSFLIESQAGGYLISGSDTTLDASEPFLLEIDSNGNELWFERYYFSQYSFATGFQKTFDNCYVLFGTTGHEMYSTVNSEVFILKVDSHGSKQWSNIYRINNNSINECGSGIETLDGGFIITGFSDNKLFLLRLDPMGDELWSRIYNFAEYSAGLSIIETSRNYFVITGQCEVSGSSKNDAFLLKAGPTGSIEWVHYFEGEISAHGSEVIQIENGFAVVGSKDNDGFVLITDREGNELSSNTFGEQSYYEYFRDIVYSNDHSLVLCGYKQIELGKSFAYIVKTNEEGTL